VTWNQVASAASYEVYRRGPLSTSTYALVATTTTSTRFHDTNVTTGNAYVYKVRAHNSAGYSNYSFQNLATTMAFSDDPARIGTPIKSIHLAELRAAVNAVRQLAGIGNGTYTDV